MLRAILKAHAGLIISRHIYEEGWELIRNETGHVSSVVGLDDGMLTGVTSLPHGYGMRYRCSEPVGPQINRLTAASRYDPLSKTPYHKYVQVSIEKDAQANI